MSGQQMRRDLLSGEWVIYAPSRRRRPIDTTPRADSLPVRASLSGGAPAYDPDCPFCPGNERLLPPILMQVPASTLGVSPGDEDTGGSVEGSGAWLTRVVRNLYPAVGDLEDRDSEGQVRSAAALPAASPIPPGPSGLFEARPARGRHEVIIESACHNARLDQLSPGELGVVVETYHERYRSAAASPGVEVVALFRNQGALAGGSLAHPHAQLVALDVVPQAMQDRRRRARDYQEQTGRCLLCDMLGAELADSRRVVSVDASFAVFVPFASRGPFALWIVPLAHEADFGAVDDAERAALAGTLGPALARLHAAKGPDLAYNLLVHSTPNPGTLGLTSALHWFVEVRPRLTTPAGFELLTGVDIDPSLPEEAAACMRQAPVGPADS